MIVKIINGSCIRHTHCISAIVVPEIQEEGRPVEQWSIIYLFDNATDLTFSLSQGDKIYYLNDDGKTIDKDFRMCCAELTK